MIKQEWKTVAKWAVGTAAVICGAAVACGVVGAFVTAPPVALGAACLTLGKGIMTGLASVKPIATLGYSAITAATVLATQKFSTPQPC